MEITRTRFGEGPYTILLTEAEVEQAYRERRKHYNKIDLIHKLKNMIYCDGDPEDDEEYEIGDRLISGKALKGALEDEDFINRLIDEFENALDSNDSYWESFWETATDIIEEVVAEAIPKSEKEIKQDKNRIKYSDLIRTVQTSTLSFRAKEEIMDAILNEYVG